MAKRGF
ncbi:hypothetical protein VCCP1040_1422, partial [Vibrio cholerae CP1040(13)]